VKNLYGDEQQKLDYQSGNVSYYVYKEAGIGFGMDNNEVRTISIFDMEL
jgi:hypothetical protein